MIRGMKLIFYTGSYPKKQTIGLLWHAQILSKVHPRYFQNDEFALSISRINGGMKQSFCMWLDISRSSRLIQNMSWTLKMLFAKETYCFRTVLFFYYCDLLWCKTFRIMYRVLSGFIGFYRVCDLLWCKTFRIMHRVLSGFIGFYRVCDLLWCKTFRIMYRVLQRLLSAVGLGFT